MVAEPQVFIVLDNPKKYIIDHHVRRYRCIELVVQNVYLFGVHIQNLAVIKFEFY